MEFFKKMQVYRTVPKQRCRDVTGWEPIKVRWVDTNKQDEANPKYRSRLVAKDYKKGSDPELYTATPPIDALRLLISLAAIGSPSRGARRRIMTNDVARAYFNAPSLSPTFVDICEEDFEEGDEDNCGELRVSMYGTRPAAQNWQRCFTELLVGQGFTVTRASTCIMRHNARDIDLLVHGDDFVSVGDEEDLQWLQKVLESKFEISTQVLGPGDNNDKEVKVLNRIITASEFGYTYEADARHSEFVVKTLNLQNTKPLSSPGSDVTQEGEEVLLEHGRFKMFQTICARAIVLSIDRSDIQHIAK